LHIISGWGQRAKNFIYFTKGSTIKVEPITNPKDIQTLKKLLEKILGAKIDLVTRKALKPSIGKRILEDVRYVT